MSSPVIRDVEVLESWRDRPGHISRASSNAVIFACVVTVMVAAFGSHFLWEYYKTDDDSGWVPVLLPLFAIGWISLTAMPRWQLARLLRVAVLLPVAHLIAMVVAWIGWHFVHRTRIEYYFEPHVNMIDALPITAVVVGAIVLFALLGWLIARGRRGEPVHAFVMLALATFLLVGLWLPIASAIAWYYERELDLGGTKPITTLVFVLGPPLVLATLFTAIAFRRPALHARTRWLAGLVVAVLFALAVIIRMGRADNPYALFGSLIHVVFALAFVAVSSLVVLGVATGWSTRRAAAAFRSSTLTGTIATDGEDSDVGCFEIASWLRGPRALLRPFTVVTPTGATLIHGGAQLLMPLPAATTQLDVGESLVGLRTGDTVVIAGLDEAGGDSPYRGLGAPVGGGGVMVGCAGQQHGFAHVALMVWRPCVAYLVILLAVGVPGLLAAGVFN